MLILARLLPAYLRDLQRAAVAGGMPERQLIDNLERLLGVVTNVKAKKVLERLKIDPAFFFAVLGEQKKLPKLAAFLEKRVLWAL